MGEAACNSQARSRCWGSKGHAWQPMHGFGTYGAWQLMHASEGNRPGRLASHPGRGMLPRGRRCMQARRTQALCWSHARRAVMPVALAWRRPEQHATATRHAAGEGNQAYMHTNCRKSCEVCEKSSSKVLLSKGRKDGLL